MFAAGFTHDVDNIWTKALRFCGSQHISQKHADYVSWHRSDDAPCRLPQWMRRLNSLHVLLGARATRVYSLVAGESCDGIFSRGSKHELLSPQRWLPLRHPAPAQRGDIRTGAPLLNASAM